MAWTAKKTWAVEPWTAADANAYIRDDVKSYRNIAVGQKVFVDGPSTVSLTTYANFVTHSNLCPVAPDETTTMYVLCQVVISGLVGVTGWNTRIKNQGGTVISSASYGTSNYTTHSRLGTSTIAPGTNPGFSVEMLVVGAGSITVTFQTIVWIGASVKP